MDDKVSVESSIFEIDKNGTLTGIKKSGLKLQKLEIPENVKKINFSTLKKIQTLQEIVLPSHSCGSFCETPSYTLNLTSHSPVLFEWWVENHKYDGKTLCTMEEIDLSKYANSDGKPFTKIENFLFSNVYECKCKDYYRLKRINLGPYVKWIGECAFMGYEKLTYIELGENVQFIGADAFWNCLWTNPEDFISHSPLLFQWWVNNHKYGDKTLRDMETIDLDEYTNSDGKPFTIISEYAFENCFKTKSVKISNKNIEFHSGALNNLPETTLFYVSDELIKEKIEKSGIESKRIFVKPILKEN